MNTNELEEKINRHLGFLAQDKDNINLLVELSDLYLADSNMAEAQKYLNQAEAIDREACLNKQGLLHLTQGNIPQAKAFFREALVHEDTRAIRFNLGYCHFMSNEFEEAWTVLSALIQGEHFPEAEILVARLLHRQDAMEEAIRLTGNVLQHNPDNAEALGLLALLYFDFNELELATQAFESSLELDPENYDARLIRVLVRLMEHQTDIEEIEDLLQINPQDSRLWFALGNTHMIEGDLQAALPALQKAVEIYPEFYDCHIVLAWCQLLNNQLDAANTTYETAAAIIPDLPDSWGGLALIHALSVTIDKAQALIAKANAIDPNCFLTQMAQMICMTHSDPTAAKQQLIKALTNSKLPISEKLAFIMGDLQENETIH